MARYELVDLLFLKNRENVLQILNIFCYRVNVPNSKIFASGEVLGTTYFEMRVSGQIQIILGVLDMKKVEDH